MTTAGQYLKGLIAHPLISDGATITVTSEASSKVPGTNLQTIYPTDPWVASTVAGLQVNLDLGASPDPYRLFWLGFHNAGAGDQWTVKVSTSSDFSTGVTTVGSATDLLTNSSFEDARLYPYSHSHLLLPSGSERTERYVRLELSISSPKMPTGYGGADFFRASRCYVAEAWQFPFHVRPGYGFAPVLEQARSVDTFGGRRRVAGSSREVGSLDFEIDYQTLEEILANAVKIDRLRGSSEDVLVMLDPDSDRAPDLTWYGTLDPEASKHKEGDEFRRRYRIQSL